MGSSYVGVREPCQNLARLRFSANYIPAICENLPKMLITAKIIFTLRDIDCERYYRTTTLKYGSSKAKERQACADYKSEVEEAAKG